MQEQHRRFYSHHLGQDIDMLVFGTWGYPVVIFPTSGGHTNEARDFKLIEEARPLVEAGRVKLFCIDSIDAHSWYAKHLEPRIRVQNHVFYDQFLSEELVPMLQRECHVDKIGVAGCSFGGFHALNFAFRHPHQVAHLFTMGAAFDIRQFVDGYHDDNVYYNNPPEYIPGAQSEHFQWMNIILGTAEHDFCKESNFQMARLLSDKGIHYTLDVKPFGNHDWPVWREMFPQYLNTIG
ncbi:alpha/beta fold hydrolase [Hymenobacter armeniacus]|uniref:Esterase n=1 Tax=Hymenobacter armeniacus TaxID=2771358 RepID=A0ABR8JUH0_9BACT|nr:alpha/beta fold hydrolase [Hymenobacter armeniacus]MBD2722750.1 esterase [Hymenobacter armeniacus]